MWHLDARAPRPRGLWWAFSISRLSTFLYTVLYGGPESRQRLFQTLVCDLGQVRSNTFRGNGIGRWCFGALTAAERRLLQSDARDGAPAEELVDPVADHIREMLDFDRRWAFDPQHQRAGLLRPR
jgi:hypothetical protein